MDALRRTIRASAPALLAIAVFTTAVRAQTPAENIAAARSLGLQGIRLAEEGNCPAAIEKLERAEALYHAPTMLGRLGECQVQVGQIVLGTENLNRVVREQLAPGAPKAFQDAQERARRALEQALPRIAHLVLHVAPDGVSPTVTVAGTPVPEALLGAERPTDPGTYEIVASAPGYLPAKTSVTLAEGARQEVSITLRSDPARAVKPATAPTSATASTAPAHSEPDRPASKGSSNTFAYVLLGVGATGILAGGVTGLMAMSKKNELECPNNQCPPSEHEDYDRTKSLALISTVGFGVGIAGAATGMLLLLMGSEREAPPGISAVTARPFVAADSVGVWGSF